MKSTKVWPLFTSFDHRDVMSPLNQALLLVCLSLITARSGLSILWMARRWTASKAIGASSFWCRTRQMVSWTLATSRGRLLVYSTTIAVVAAGFLLVSPAPKQISIPLAAVGVLLMGQNLAGALLPPTVLLLGSSNWETIRLLGRLHRGLYPYRVVCLLEPEACQSGRINSLYNSHFWASNLRQLNTDQWRDVVFSIMDTVPYLVVDTRTWTDFVEEEVQRILQSDMSKQTVFVDDSNGENGDCQNVASRAAVLSELASVGPTDVVRSFKDIGLYSPVAPLNNPVTGPMEYNRTSRLVTQQFKRVHSSIERYRRSLFAVDFGIENPELAIDAKTLLELLNGQPGDNAVTVYHTLRRDISAVETFIDRWGHSVKGLTASAASIRKELCGLQLAFDQAYPGFVEEMTELLDGHQDESDARSTS